MLKIAQLIVRNNHKNFAHVNRPCNSFAMLEGVKKYSDAEHNEVVKSSLVSPSKEGNSDSRCL